MAHSLLPEHGILLLDKPAGLTSTRALGRAKKLLGIRKAGHTGALDPMATGLLPLCFGEATKVSGQLLEADKRYLAGVRLGITTDTGDAEGRVTGREPVPDIDRTDLERVLARFTGTMDQVPPMYSALRVDGRRLHELAREGREVPRRPRKVTIHSLELDDFADGRFGLEVHCSKGTYIRTLAMDIGRALGCGAHLDALRRSASGPFGLSDAVTLDALEAEDPDQRRGMLLPIESAFPSLARIELGAEGVRAIRHGQAVVAPERVAPGPVLLMDAERLLALGDAADDGRIRPRRLFHLPS